MSLLKELHNCYRFFFKTPKEHRQIVFYSEKESYIAFIEGPLQELIQTHGQTISYITSDPNDALLNKTEGIRSFYIRDLLPFFMTQVNCRAFVMTLTDLNNFHLKRSIHEDVNYHYLFHSLNSTHRAYNEGAFDHYDTIHCVGTFQKDEIRKREALLDHSPKTLIDAGYYRVERIFNQFQNRSQTSKENDSPTVLIAPSWSKDNIFEYHGAELLQTLSNAKFNLIVRPHPEMMKRKPEVFNALLNQFQDQPNITFETEVTTDDALIEADLLITDWSGIALEFAFGTERPVLYLDVPAKIHNSNFGDLGLPVFEEEVRSKIGLIHPANELGSLPESLSQLYKRKDEFRETIQQLREENIFAFTQSSKVSAKAIVDSLKPQSG